jgi:tetratricopeptide (TPR) repeat protein
MSDYFDNGLQALYAGRLEEAEELLSKAIDEDPKNAETFYYRGKTRWQSGNLTAALNDFYKALDINPLYNQAKVSIEMVKQILAFRNPDLYNP